MTMFGKLKGLFQTRLKIRFFFSIIAFVVAAVCVSMTSIAVWLENSTISLINSYITDHLSQVSYSAEFMSQTARSLALQVYLDSDLASLLYSYPDNLHQTNSVLKRMKQYQSTMLYVDSVYFYDTTKKLFFTDLSDSLISSHDSFFDEGAQKIMDNYRDYPILKPIPRIIENASEQVETGKYVYSFLLYETSKNMSDPASIVMVNVSYEWMHGIINALSNNERGDLFIIDREGRLVTDSRDNVMLTDMAQLPHIQRIISKSDKSDGYFIAKINGEKSVVTYASSDALDWKYVLVTPYWEVTGKLSAARTGLVLIALFLIVLCSIMAFVFSKRLHRPIDDIHKKLRKIEAENHISSGERKQQYLRALLEAHDVPPVKQKFAQLEIDLQPDCAMSVILLQIDDYKEFCEKHEPSDRSLYIYGIINIANELANVRFKCEPVKMNSGRIALLCGGIQGEDTAIAFEALVADIQSKVAEYLNISLSAAVSLLGDSIADLPELYREAEDGLRYRLFYGRRCRVFYSDVECRPEEFSYPYKSEKRLNELLLSGKADEAFEIYLDIIVEASGAAYDAFNLTLLRLDMGLQSVINQLGGTVKQDINFDNHTFLNHITSRESIEEINEAFSEKYHLIEDTMKYRRSSKQETIVTQVKEMIEQQFADPELALTVLADKVGLTPVYLGRLFKQITAKTVGEYIHAVRIKNAKRMLCQTSDSVVDIALKTGFSNTTYFYTVFKKTEGITPNEYRQEMHKSEEDH